MKVKDRPGALIRRFGLTLLVVPGVLGIPACAASSLDERTVRIPEAPVDDAASVTVSDGGTTTLDLGDGAHLIIPPGAMTPGTTVSASYGDPPQGDWGTITPLSHPVELISDPPDAIHGLLTLEFPVSGDLDAGAFGVSTFDESTGAWTPVTATLDTARNMIVAQIAHFSWWNPFSWDWAGLGASVNQRVGEIVGKRAPAARCSRGQATPEWVSMVNGVSNDAAIAVRGCAEGENGLVVVELQNNRPYGMFLHYGAPVKFGWHERGDSALDVVRNKFADMVTIPDQLYIPPLGRASVGIYQFSGFREFRAGADWRSISIDVLANLLGDTLGKIPQAGACLSGFMGHPLGEFSVGKVRDGVKEMLRCVTREAASLGYFDATTIQQLEAIASKLTLIGFVLKFGEIEWKLLDLFVDNVVVGDAGGLGAGFSVLGRSTAPSTSPPPTSPPDSSPPATSPPPTSPPPTSPPPTSPPATSPPATSPPGTSPPATQPPPSTRTLTVYNQVTNGGSQMREDTPAYLSTVTKNYCRRDGCMLSGTDVLNTGSSVVAECWVYGDRTTNGQDNSTIDDSNPNLYQSTLWYRIQWPDGRRGFLSEVWITAAHRGGAGLQRC